MKSPVTSGGGRGSQESAPSPVDFFRKLKLIRKTKKYTKY
jgi:hypothetical protein